MGNADGHIILKVDIDKNDTKKAVGNLADVMKKVKSKLGFTGAELTKSIANTKDLKTLQKELDKTNEKLQKAIAKRDELIAKEQSIVDSAIVGPDKNPVFTKADETNIKKMDSEIAVLGTTIDADRAKAEELGIQIKKATEGNNPAVAGLTNWMEKLGVRLSQMIKRVFVFSLMYKALRKILDIIKNVAMGDDEFRKSIEQLSSALWVLATPILNIIIPALKTLVNWITQATVLLGRFIAKLSGKSYSSLVNNAKALKKQSDEYKNMGKNLKETNKQLADFDELNILGNESGGGDTGLDTISSGEYNNTLSEIGALTGIALVGLGIILLFSGHPFIGITMIATGYAMGKEGAYAISSNLGEKEKTKLAKIGAITGAALMGLGVLLLFTTIFWKYGLGMIGMGAMAIYTAYTLGAFSQDIKSLISNILIISGIVAFTLGVILLFVPKTWGYGLALMALGVAEIIGATTFGGEEFKSGLKNFILQHWKELYGISAAMVVLGIVLLLVNAKLMWRYGLTLIVLGISGLVGTTVLGGQELLAELKSFVLNYWPTIYGIGTAMVILGIVLLFSTFWQVGLTLLVGGIGALVGTTALGGTDLLQEIKSVIEPFKAEIMAFGSAMFVLGIVLCFVPGCLGVGLTLLGLGATAVFAGSKLDSSALKTRLSSALDDVNTSARQGVDKINSTLADIQLPSNTAWSTDFGVSNIPKLARGAVIPPNKEFLAVLGDQKHGTNIETPLATMIEAFETALASNGYSSNQDININFTGNLAQLARVLNPVIEQENKRKGPTLVKGGAY